MTCLELQSGVSASHEPFVQLLVDGAVVTQMDPGQAREFARNLLEAAEAAEQDAFIYDWVIDGNYIDDYLRLLFKNLCRRLHFQVDIRTRMLHNQDAKEKWQCEIS